MALRNLLCKNIYAARSEERGRPDQISQAILATGIPHAVPGYWLTGALSLFSKGIEFVFSLRVPLYPLNGGIHHWRLYFDVFLKKIRKLCWNLFEEPTSLGHHVSPWWLRVGSDPLNRRYLYWISIWRGPIPNSERDTSISNLHFSEVAKIEYVASFSKRETKSNWTLWLGQKYE